MRLYQSLNISVNKIISTRTQVIMHENWLQRYIQEHYQQIGFSQIHGPYQYGADFKGIYAHQPVKIEAEWDYLDYVKHRHSLKFADVLVVATLEPVPQRLKDKLPAIIINLNRAEVIQWAQPRVTTRNNDDYSAYPWRRLARSLLDLYAFYRKERRQGTDFVGSNLVSFHYKSQKPAGFQFRVDGKEEGFEGQPEDKAAWDTWLFSAHAVANHFHLKPALLRPTWIDRIALYYNHTGRITEGEVKRFKPVAELIDDLILRRES
jgi:hypothetical protein